MATSENPLHYVSIVAGNVKSFEKALAFPLLKRLFRITTRRYLSESKAPFAMEMQVILGSGVDANLVKRSLASFPDGANLVIQSDQAYRSQKKLALFDMDSTLIAAEVIDELAHKVGVGKEVTRITERAMQGEIDFDQSFAERLALLKGSPVSVLDDVYKRIKLVDGAHDLLVALKRLGFVTALASGGFTYFAKRLQSEGLLALDHIFANELEIENGRLTGKSVGPIVNGARKAEILKDLAGQYDVNLNEVLAVGDGANDIPMLQLAGLGVAFNAKPKTRQSVSVHLEQKSLLSILPLLGLNDWDIERITRQQRNEKGAEK